MTDHAYHKIPHFCVDCLKTYEDFLTDAELESKSRYKCPNCVGDSYPMVVGNAWVGVVALSNKLRAMEKSLDH